MNRYHRIGTPYTLMALAAAAAGLGFLLTVANPGVPGSEPLTVEDVVDAVCLLVFGLLGAALLHRGIAEGLGRALLVLAGLISLDYFLAGLADALAQGESPPPAAAQLSNLGGQAAFIAAFFLLVFAPLALFPTGRLPSARWRWLAWVGVGGVLGSILSVLLAPGPVDEDAPAWGDNPIGVEQLGGLTDLLETVGVVLLALTMGGGLAAFVVRWVRYRGARRRQMAWLTLGVVTMVLGFVTDIGGSELVQVLMALAIFGTLLVGMAWPLLGPLGRTAATESPVHAAAAKQARTVARSGLAS
jgi:hypothetical protein